MAGVIPSARDGQAVRSVNTSDEDSPRLELAVTEGGSAAAGTGFVAVCQREGEVACGVGSEEDGVVKREESEGDSDAEQMH